MNPARYSTLHLGQNMKDAGSVHSHIAEVVESRMRRGGGRAAYLVPLLHPAFSP